MVTVPAGATQTAPYSTLVSGSFTGTGQSAAFTVQKTDFRVALGGTFSATVQLECNRLNGLGWNAISSDPTVATGTPAAYTGPVELAVYEALLLTQYRWNCTAFTSGPVLYEIQG